MSGSETNSTLEPQPRDQQPSAALPARVPVRQFYSALKVLLGSTGPFASFYLPVDSASSRAASLESIISATELSSRQAAFGRSLVQMERAADDAMMVGFISHDGATFAQSFPEGPHVPLVEIAALPRLAPVIEAEQRLRHHLLAVVTAEGIDLLTFPRHGRATLHRAEAGDADYTALLIAEAARQTATPLVLIAAEPQAGEELRQLVSSSVQVETRVKVMDAGLDLDALSERAVHQVANSHATQTVQTIQDWKFERSHGLAHGGVQAALHALRSDDVRLVLVTDHADDVRQAWFGRDPARLAIDLEDASSVDVLDGDLVPARLVDVMLRSALLRDIPVVVVPDLPETTLPDGLGVISDLTSRS